MSATSELPYQCTTEALPAGQPACFEVWRCAGRCSSTITINGHEMSTDRCRWRWETDGRVRGGPLPCSPAMLQIVIGSAPAGPPTELPLPSSLVRDVTRSGTSMLMYVAEACATDDGVQLGEPTHPTGFAGVDAVLRGKAAELTLPPGQCAVVRLIASRFECEVESTPL